MNSVFDQLARINHKLIRLGGIDRNTFFGRIDILDFLSEELYVENKEKWRKFGRYGNIIIPDLFVMVLRQSVSDAHFTFAELEEISKWMKAQNTIDQAVASVMIDFFLKDEYNTIKQ